ncbi:hypothetical protein BH11PSE8_BH11PSE8_43600 [soil metagenome]
MARARKSLWGASFQRMLGKMTRATMRAGTKAVVKATRQAGAKAARKAVAKRAPPPGAGDWIAGVAVAPAGARRYHLYRPPGMEAADRPPLLVMLHGCQQDAKGFALATRMNRIAARERFCVLYPDQDRLANVQGCWNWYDTRSGRAQGEAAMLMAAVDQVVLLYRVDVARVAVAVLSAGAGMAALLATRYPERFAAVAMHSGVAPGTAYSTATALGAMRGHRASAPLPTAGTGPALPPLLVIQGSLDGVVAQANGRAAALLWADAAGARAGLPRRVQRGARHAMTITDFKAQGRIAASLCEVASLGHAWSGGAAGQPFSDAKGPDASRMVWAFVAKQFATK